MQKTHTNESIPYFPFPAMLLFFSFAASLTDRPRSEGGGNLGRGRSERVLRSLGTESEHAVGCDFQRDHRLPGALEAHSLTTAPAGIARDRVGAPVTLTRDELEGRLGKRVVLAASDGEGTGSVSYASDEGGKDLSSLPVGTEEAEGVVHRAL